MHKERAGQIDIHLAGYFWGGVCDFVREEDWEGLNLYFWNFFFQEKHSNELLYN